MLLSKRSLALIATVLFVVIEPAFPQSQQPPSTTPDLTFPSVLYGAA
jgi:hypothetical protein